MKNVILTILILSLAILSACQKTEIKQKDFKPGDLKYDEIQKLVIAEYTDKTQKGPFFCLYETLWIEEDSFYTRKFIYAYIEAIDQNLKSDYSITLPIGLTIDKETGKIIRHIAYSKQYANQEAMQNDFPEEIYNQIIDAEPEVIAEKILKMHNEAINHAKKYYNMTD